MSIEQIFNEISGFETESIYDGPSRLAQPDEVWNFRRGDGLEKAILMANIIMNRQQDAELRISLEPGQAVLEDKRERWEFPTAKEIGVGELSFSPR